VSSKANAFIADLEGLCGLQNPTQPQHVHANGGVKKLPARIVKKRHKYYEYSEWVGVPCGGQVPQSCFVSSSGRMPFVFRNPLRAWSTPNAYQVEPRQQAQLDNTAVFTNPVHDVSYEIWDRTTKRRKLSIRGEGDVPTLLFIHSSNDSFDDDMRRKRGIEELDKSLGEWAGRGKVLGLAEHFGLDHARTHKSCADVRDLMVFVKFVPEGFVQGYASGFGGTVV
jgi:hypothetical protein